MAQLALEQLGHFEERIHGYVSKFKALSDPTRLRVLFLLKHAGELCVCDLTEALKIPQSSVSYHLRVLEKAGLIERRDEGTWSYCRLNDTAVNELLSPQCCSVLGFCDEAEPVGDDAHNCRR